MYFKMTKTKSNQYLQLVESYRNDEGKPRQHVIANLCNVSKCSEIDISKLCHSFLRTLNVKDVVFFEDLQAEQSHDYGDVLPVVALWQQLHLDSIIQNSLSPHIKIDVPKATLLMVANKFADPQSKLGAWKWFDRSVFCFSREFQYFPTQDKSVLQNLYRSLDYLTESKDEIEKQLYHRLQCFGLKAELVLYDITSSHAFHHWF